MPTVTRLTSNGVFQSLGGFDEVSLNSGNIKFNGTGNSLTLPSNAAYNFGTGDFTIEAWVYTGVSTGYQTIIDTRDGDFVKAYIFGISTQKLDFIYSSSRVTSSASITLNAWNHVAVTRASGTIRLFINGVVDANTASYSSAIDATSFPSIGGGRSIGANSVTGYYFNGYISNVRIIKGTALYTTNFTPPTAPLLPVSNTSLLLSTNSQNPFKDSSVNNFTITKAGTPSFNTLGPFYFPANTSINLANTNNNPVLGSNTNIITSTTSNGVVMISNGFDEVSMSSGSILFNGSSYLTIPSNAAVTLGTNDYTIEMWVYPNNNSQNAGLFQLSSSATYASTSQTNQLSIQIWQGYIQFGTNSAFNQGNGVAANAYVANRWYHVAMTRQSGGLTKFFINGVEVGSITDTTNYTGSYLVVGGFYQLPIYVLNGNLSNFRLINGTAVYTANFTPPQMALSPIANTSLLLNNFAAEPFVDNSPNNFTLTRNGTPSANTLSPFANTQQKVLNTGTMMTKEFDEIAFMPVIDSSLKLWLDAGQTASYPGSGTTWTDLSGNGNNGTLTNGPTYTSSNGGSLVFDGTNDYVTLGSSLSGTLAGTISFWIKLTNTITTGYAGNQRPWGKNGDFECRWGGTGGGADRSLATDIGGILSLVSVQNTWLNTVWYNITIVYNGATNSSALYVQGVLDATGTAGNVTGLTGNWIIGATSSTAGPLNGQISQYLIYNRALSVAEVQQNFNALRGRYGI